MKLVPDPELRELAGSVRRLLATRASTADTRAVMGDPTGYDRPLWKVLTGEMGLAGIDSPFLAQGLVFEELGYALLDAPYLASVGLALPALQAAGGEEALALAARIGTGEVRAALALADEGGNFAPSMTTTATAGGRLTGVKSYVVDGAVADELVVTAMDEEGLGLYAVAADAVRVEPLASVDLTRWQARVVLDEAPGRRLGTGDATAALSAALDRSGVLLACEQVGVAQRCLDLSVEYAKTRSQYGRRIGSYQAIKHRLVDMHSAIEAARAAAYHAAWATDDAPVDLPVAAAIVQSVAAETATFVAAGCIQVHGGIGFTWEHDAHLFYRRAHVNAALLGSPAYHRANLAARLGLGA